MYRMSPIQPWLEALDKRPGERTMTDVQYVAELLRSIATLRDLPHELILDLASCAYLEDLEEGVTLFRQGDRGTNWYAVLSGSVSAFPSRDATDKLRQVSDETKATDCYDKPVRRRKLPVSCQCQA
ncbi:rap guanine nucleotide exchange factor 4-like [Amphibalanus amphitrite]|uniref:rap guanine nucleotide exchange factor 4-like n=1 Tax=Amphibalanus amphitrite TaxID=1232801 RepID=UPI001C92850D|nr:rap guanine nucleotide exchange factor 4-like [Amphibalanus amphitrite]